MTFYIGWELEYQNSDYDYDTFERKLDFEAYFKYITDPVLDKRLNNTWGCWSDITVRCAINRGINRWRLLDSLTDFARPPDAFYIQKHTLPEGLTCVHDGSVAGGEIRPETKNTPEQAIKLLKDLETLYKFDSILQVNHECSFHVHISKEGVNHRYGPNMQGFMIQYISDNIRRIPTSVLNRWSKDNRRWMKRYFELCLSENKYSFVAFRGQTWEFRCFGGIQSAEEGEICINLAIEAYTWAREQVQAGRVFEKMSNVFRTLYARVTRELNKRNRVLEVA